jgi:hypothetical protein
MPVAILALWSSVAKADGLGDWTASQSCATGFVDVVENSIVLTGPDGGGCGGANWVKIETTIPEGTFSVSFDWSYWTYDGWIYDPPQYGVNGVYALLTQQNQASGTKTVTVTAGDIFTFRQYSIDSCCQAGHLTISNLSLWEFTTTSTTSTTMTTTTIVPETTVLATNPTTTTVPETTSTSSTSTTTSTTSTSTTTTTSTSTTTTTTSTVPAPVETFVPVEPEPDETSTTEPPVEETTTTVTLPEETTTTTEPETTTTETYPETTTTVEPNLEPNLVPLADEEVQALIAEATTIEELQAALEELTPEQVEQVVEEILNQEEPTQEQAVALATSPEVLAVISVDNAEKIFQALQVDELTEEQVSELIEAVQSAPEEIRTQFETSVDIFGSDLGDYVPVGSNIPVDTRRTLIAVAAGAAMASVGARKYP